MSALGDSITRALNSGAIVLTEHPEYSFSTGDSNEVNSHYRRLLALPNPPAIVGKNFNRAESGARVGDLNVQAQSAVTDGAQYVTILIGANDACRDSEADMTSVSSFRTRLQTAMNTLASGLPDSRIYVISIPDIYRLWQVGKDNSSARLRWSLYGICQSMLANPESTAPEDEARRQRVRQRVIDFNAQLAQVCGQFLRCRFDGNAAFNTQFNLSELSGHDYFHPSLAGQNRAAQVTWDAGFNFADRTAPVSSITPARSPDGAGGWYSSSVSIGLSATDTGTGGGVKGHEYRLAGASGSTGWTRYATPFPISAAGTTTVEFRSIDVNGNVEASKTEQIRIDKTVPGLTLTVPPAEGRNGSHTTAPVIVGVSATDDNGVSSLSCTVDGRAATLANESSSGSSRSADVSVSDDGAHVVECRAEDVAGNPKTASASLKIDTTPPAVSLTSGPSDPTNDPTPTFEFATEPAEQGARFECRLDSSDDDDFTPCNSGHTTAPLDQGRHVFEVRAIDAAGNVGAPVSHAFTVDTDPPAPSIVSGPPSPTRDSTPTFGFSPSDADVARFECRVYALGAAGAAPDFGPCSADRSHTAAPLSDGRHAFEVRAVDGAGNTGPAAVYSFTVDTVGPQTHIDTGPAERGADRTPAFTFSSSEPGSTFECRLHRSDAPATGFGACSGPGDTHSSGELADGDYTFSVRATDRAGNVDETPASQTFTIAPSRTAHDSDGDAIEDSLDACPTQPAGTADGCPAADRGPAPPDTALTSGPPSATNDPTPTFAFAATEPGSGFECRLDDASFSPCGSPFTAARLADGAHRFHVRATDATGSVDPSPALLAFTVDTRAPRLLRVSVAPKTFRVGSAATAVAARRQAGTTFRYRLLERAQVRIAIARVVGGRRAGRRCVAPRRAPRGARRCSRRLGIGVLLRDGRRGSNSVPFSGRLGAGALAPGRYLATLSATDAAGNRSRPVRLRFTVVRG